MSPATASVDEPKHDRLAVLDAERALRRRDLAEAIGSRYPTVGGLEHREYSPRPDAAWVWRSSPRTSTTVAASGWPGPAPRLEREVWWAPRGAAWVHADPCAHAQRYDVARRSTTGDRRSSSDPCHQDQGCVGPGIRGPGSADDVIEVAAHGSTEVPERTDD